MKFYVMTGLNCVEEYARPGNGLETIQEACANGALQFLNRDPLTVELADEGGVQFPDFLLHEHVPLVSEKLRQAFLDLDLDNLFYKQVILVCRDLGLAEPYWLALPPRIDCLNWRKCEIQEDQDKGSGFWALFHFARKIVIDENKIGYYRIFKLPENMLNQEIIITEDVKDFLAKRAFENLYFQPLDGEKL